MASIIVYFSRKNQNYVNGAIKNLTVGNTEVAAGILQKLTGAEMFAIEPVCEYSKNYNECIEQARVDQRRNARPALKNYPDSMGGYDTVYLGYPNYWGTMPMAVFTFLEYFDFAGKTILPFCTHEGSGLGSSVEDIRQVCPRAEIKKGLALHGGSVQHSEDMLKRWAASMGQVSGRKGK